jgi:hypothetical protein
VDVVKLIAESLSHDERHIVPTPLSGIREDVCLLNVYLFYFFMTVCGSVRWARAAAPLASLRVASERSEAPQQGAKRWRRV